MWKRLQVLLFCLGLAGMGTPSLAAAPPATRPQVTSLTLDLEDGRTYALKSEDLQDEKGGVVFWNDWAVYNLLFPFCLYQGGQGLKPKDLIRLWNVPAPNGELPAFLVRSGDKYCYPLNPAAPGAAIQGTAQGTAFRSHVVAIRVGLADGRSYALNSLELNDERSGVLFWQDFPVQHMLVPFYAIHTGLPTTPGDVIRLWSTGRRAAPKGQNSFAGTATLEMPGFLVKPQCIPQYPLSE